MHAFTLRKMDAAGVRAIAAWQYAPPY